MNIKDLKYIKGAYHSVKCIVGSQLMAATHITILLISFRCLFNIK